MTTTPDFDKTVSQYAAFMKYTMPPYVDWSVIGIKNHKKEVSEQVEAINLGYADNPIDQFPHV